MWSKLENHPILGKALSMVSLGAALLVTTPAWTQGACLAAVVAVFLWIGICRKPFPRARLEKLLTPACLAAGAITAICFGFNFYNSWVLSSPAQSLSALLGVGKEELTQGVGVLLVFCASPAFAVLIGHYFQLALEDYREKRKTMPPQKGEIRADKAFFLLFFLYVVGISAILRTNFYYKDDAARAIFGYKQWDYFGRFLSTALATLVHTGDFLSDIAPLPQLLATGVLALSGVLVLYILYDRPYFTLWELISVVPLGLNPYFLECLSYRFDAPYMAVSILGGILPLLFFRKKTGTYILAGMLGILMVCTTYQAATGVFPMLVIALALKQWNEGGKFRDSLIFCLKSLVGYGLGLVYFKAILMRPANAGYVSNAMPGVGELIPNMLTNLGRYFAYVKSDFKPYWLVLVVLIALGFLWVTVGKTRRKKWVSGAVSLAALVLMGVLCFGIYPMLATPLFEPRGMYGFGVFIAIIGAVAVRGRGNVPGKLPGIVLAWAFFVFSFTYGNALDLQKEYTEFRMQLVIQDLNELEPLQSEQTVTVHLSGSIGRTPLLYYQPQDYQMLNRLLPATFSGGDDLTQYRFFYYYGLPNLRMAEPKEKPPENLPILKDTLYHTISGEDGYLLIHLK